MKIYCGTDIIEIERIRESIENMGDSFINRIYTENEIKYCEARGKQKAVPFRIPLSLSKKSFLSIFWVLRTLRYQWQSYGQLRKYGN